MRGGRKGDHEVIQVEITSPVKFQVKKYSEPKVKKDVAGEKKSPEKPKEDEKKDMNEGDWEKNSLAWPLPNLYYFANIISN